MLFLYSANCIFVISVFIAKHIFLSKCNSKCKFVTLNANQVCTAKGESPLQKCLQAPYIPSKTITQLVQAGSVRRTGQGPAVAS